MANKSPLRLSSLETFASYISFDGSENLKYYNGSAWVNVSSQLNPKRQHRIKLVVNTEINKFDIYMDGKQLSKGISFNDSGVNEVEKIFIVNHAKGAAVTWYLDNLVVYENPSHAISYLDTGGKVRQTISQAPTGKVLVSENFYDGLGRGFASSKVARINSNSLNYRTGFVTSFNGNTIAGEVATIYNGDAFYETTYELSPLGRVLENGLPDAAYKIGGNTTVNSYTKNSSVTSSKYYMGAEFPAGHYFANSSVDADGGEVIEFSDKWGRKVMSKSGKIDIVKSNSTSNTLTLYADRPNLTITGQINSPTNQTVACHILKYNSSDVTTRLKIGTSPGSDDVLNTNLVDSEAFLEANTLYYVT